MVSNSGGLPGKPGVTGNDEQTMPLVSIIIPVFNGAKYLEVAIQSVIQQTYPNVELIIIDAQSTDDTLDIIRKYDDNITTWLSEPDDGMYDAICKGFDLAQGDWLHWLNADDILMPWAAHEIILFSSKTDAKWISAIPTFLDVSGNMSVVGRPLYTPRILLRKGAFYGDLLGFIQQESMFFSARLFKRLSADELREFRGFKLAGDYWLWRKFANYEKLYFLPNVIGAFRETGDNMSILCPQNYVNEVYSTRPIGRWVILLRPFLMIMGLFYTMLSTRNWSSARRSGK